ncbi:type II secretion system protein [Desulfurobacterium sp.]
MKNGKSAFTLLEILIVVSLMAVLFAAVEFFYSGIVFSSGNIERRAVQLEDTLSLYSQFSKQLFSFFKPENENFLLTQDRLSFYTLYPVFYTGGVRAVYLFEKADDGRVKVIYQEFPYPDGKLESNGTKEIVLGEFSGFDFKVLDGNHWTENFKGNFTGVAKLSVDGREFLITGKVE